MYVYYCLLSDELSIFPSVPPHAKKKRKKSHVKRNYPVIFRADWYPLFEHRSVLSAFSLAYVMLYKSSQLKFIWPSLKSKAAPKCVDAKIYEFKYIYDYSPFLSLHTYKNMFLIPSFSHSLSHSLFLFLSCSFTLSYFLFFSRYIQMHDKSLHLLNYTYKKK